MAIAEKELAHEFNQPATTSSTTTWVFLGDGCLMEGISHEACSLAGTWAWEQTDLFLRRQRHFDRRPRGRLVHRRHAEALLGPYGWKVIPNVNGHDFAALDAAIAAAKTSTDKPVMICCKTVIGMGSPNKAGPRRSRRAAGRR